MVFTQLGPFADIRLFEQGGPGTSAAYYSYWARDPATVALWLQEEFNPRIAPVLLKPVAADMNFQRSQASVATADGVSEDAAKSLKPPLSVIRFYMLTV